MSTIMYIIPAELLQHAAGLLQPPERLFFVTGTKILDGRVIVLTRLIDVDNVASRVHVTPNPASLLRVHQELLASGLDIEAQFHSHPGRLREATLPSPIDLATARRWEVAPFLGAVFSEGGRYVRFFNHSQHSEVIIHGNHIKTSDPNCFELPESCCVEMPAEESEPGRLVPDRPAAENPLVEPEENAVRQGLVCGLWGPWF